MPHHWHGCPECGVWVGHDDPACPHFKDVQPSAQAGDPAPPPRVKVYVPLPCADHGGPFPHNARLSPEWEARVKATT
jgi:hypothetical protein